MSGLKTWLSKANRSNTVRLVSTDHQEIKLVLSGIEVIGIVRNSSEDLY